MQKDEVLEQVLDLLIVGSGFSGLCLAIQAQKKGLRWHLLEQAAELGGTWRDNHYPGAACDIPSNLYSFSFLPNPNWTRLYPPQAEIKAYMDHCADTSNIRHGLQFNARVVRAQWLAQSCRWQVTTADGSVFHSRTLAVGTGGLSRPQMPRVDDLNLFQGQLFHSARWPQNIALQGQRVGVIGTGASSIQIVPVIAPDCATLTLFQRTPAWVIPRNDKAVSAETQALYRRNPWRQRLSRALTYVRLESRMFAFTRAQVLLRQAQKRVKRYLAHQVKDADLRQRLTPRYRLGCKRILLSDDFYPALQRPNVTLVDQAVVRATVTGVVTADGAHHALDVLIAATGFQVADAGTAFDIIGANGVDLNALWAKGPQAYLGTVVSGFPNLFLMTGPNTGLGHNSMVYIIESQARFVMAAITALESKGVAAFDVKAEQQVRFNEAVQDQLRGSVWNTGGCQSWYLASDGSNRTLWPDFTFRLRRRLAQFDWAMFQPIARPS